MIHRFSISSSMKSKGKSPGAICRFIFPSHEIDIDRTRTDWMIIQWFVEFEPLRFLDRALGINERVKLSLDQSIPLLLDLEYESRHAILAWLKKKIPLVRRVCFFSFFPEEERSRRVNRRSGVTSKRGDRSKRDDREGGGGGGGGGDKGMISKDVGRISGDTVDDSQGGLSGGGRKVYRQIRRLVTRQRISEWRVDQAVAGQRVQGLR